MAELVESVKEEGILTALLYDRWVMVNMKSSPVTEGDHAAQLAGLKEVPVIIRNMDQDTAVRAMVDSNLQRPNILPSEKGICLPYEDGSNESSGNIRRYQCERHWKERK